MSSGPKKPPMSWLQKPGALIAYESPPRTVACIPATVDSASPPHWPGYRWEPAHPLRPQTSGGRSVNSRMASETAPL